MTDEATTDFKPGDRVMKFGTISQPAMSAAGTMMHWAKWDGGGLSNPAHDPSIRPAAELERANASLALADALAAQVQAWCRDELDREVSHPSCGECGMPLDAHDGGCPIPALDAYLAARHPNTNREEP